MLERYYSFFHRCLLSCRYVMFQKRILSKSKWGAQAVGWLKIRSSSSGGTRSISCPFLPRPQPVLALLPLPALVFSVLVRGDFPYYQQSVKGVQKKSTIVDRMPQACKHFVVNEAGL